MAGLGEAGLTAQTTGVLCLACAAALIVAERRGSRAGTWLFKPFAALFFLLTAAAGSPGDSVPGVFIMAGLTASAAGDLLLIPRSRPALFRAGIAAFALAHLLYIAGFTAAAAFPDPWVAAALAAGATILGLRSWSWLAPWLPSRDRPLVAGYIVIISLMLLTSGLAATGSAPPVVFVASVMFVVSDLGVARDRFVTDAGWHPFVISPFYFGAQVLFALSV